MSLSRPVKFPWLFCPTPTFPLLKLPWLCIKCVLHNSDLFAVIYFASISKRTRRIVKSSNYPLKEIDVTPSRKKSICMRDVKNSAKVRRTWYFIHDKRGFGKPLVLQRNSQPLLTSMFFDERDHSLRSCTAGDDLNALKMGIDFLIDLFGCTIGNVFLGGNELSVLFGLGITTVKTLHLNDVEPVNTLGLRYLLGNIKVTDEYVFSGRIPKDFYCDPRMFNSRKLCFLWKGSADWVTLKMLRQFDVPQLTFWTHRFSVEDIVSYVTHWFNSENRKLEYVEFDFNNPLTIQDFKIDHLNPMPFCEKRRNRWPLNESWKNKDLSSGKDILRKDGLLATFLVKPKYIVFYVWHKRFPATV